MKVSLFHNEDAGDGTSMDEIRVLIERHGHQLIQIVEEESSAEQILDKAPDLVVAAGGDGTVAAAARVMARRGVPLAILPLGTANNIAKSLDSDGPIEQLIRGWEHARLRPLDIGIAHGDWGERLFFESVGAGLVPAGIAAARSIPADSDGSSTHKPADAVQIFQDALSRLELCRWTITLDGFSTTGDFLLVEVLNMPSIGPNLVLSPDANPSDGFFSVVIATEKHREVISQYLEQLSEGRDSAIALTPRCARHIEIQGWSDVHVDDALLHAEGSATVSMSLQSAALEFLAGACLAP